MKNIIIAYPIKKTAIQIKSVLNKNGYHVSHICATGASVLSLASELRGGVVICASILRDMSADTLGERLPAGFDVIALSKGGKADYIGNMINLPLPLNVTDFINTVAVLVSSQSSFTQRSEAESNYISYAKTILINVNEMTEMQAHKYLQNESMKKGKKIVDIAKEIIKQFDN